MNKLQHARSTYLRGAAAQPVHWQEWGEAAFAAAAAQGKPVLLDVGAVWCHWCHVMDRESYADPELAALIDEHFIAIKVDRDERPEVDARYQAAVAAISGQGGWPLTVFLTPDGTPYFGGTYFPPEERYGRPAFRRVLLAMAEAWRERREEAAETAASVLAAVEANESFGAPAPVLDAALLDRITAGMLAQYDAVHGGFGSQPKFPHPGALDVLLDLGTRVAENASAKAAGEAAVTTLRKMALGGVRDQLGGGFHRYSVDERWVVPHFEKMSYDNAELLRAYTHGFASTVDPELARVARDTLRWMDDTLSERERGGFYAAQDADSPHEDSAAAPIDGAFYTWTLAEARAVLSPGEMAVAGAYFDIGDVGDLPAAPERNVLHITRTLASVARSLGVELEYARQLLRSAEAKLRAARAERPAPLVDRTIYAGWNALCCSAYLAAGRTLKLPETVEFALRTLERVWTLAVSDGVGRAGGARLRRVVAYASPELDAASSPAGVLDDYAFVAEACLDAWEATGELRWFTRAERLADALLAEFYDEAAGGFFDLDAQARAAATGILRAARKPLQDAPMPAGNSLAADVLLRLHALNGRPEFRAAAEKTLAAFGGVVEHFGLYAASYAKALRRLLTPALQICVVGDDALAAELASTALARYQVNKSVVRLRFAQLGALPPALAESVGTLQEHGSTFALVCAGEQCFAPVTNAEALIDLLVTL